VQRVFALLDEQPRIEDRAGAKPLEVAQGDIAFRAVTFAYVEDSAALDRVSFEIPPGTTAAPRRG